MRSIRGVGASPGRAAGVVVHTKDGLKAHAGQPFVFVCVEGTRDDADAIRASVAVVSLRGGLTGDAAILARALGKPCVVSCPHLEIVSGVLRFRGTDPVPVPEGTQASVDGAKGELELAF